MRGEWMTDEERAFAEKDAKWLRIDAWAFAIVQTLAMLLLLRTQLSHM